jgi:hypothetical protein
MDKQIYMHPYSTGGGIKLVFTSLTSLKAYFSIVKACRQKKYGQEQKILAKR